MKKEVTNDCPTISRCNIPEIQIGGDNAPFDEYDIVPCPIHDFQEILDEINEQERLNPTPIEKVNVEIVSIKVLS